MLARALRRFVIGAAVLLILLSLAPLAWSADALPACRALDGESLVFGFVIGGTGGLILGAILAAVRLRGPLPE